MSHELTEREDGRIEMAYAGETPWHGLGVKLDDVATGAEMLAAAGIDWTVSRRRLYIDAAGGGTVPVPGHLAVVRDDTQAVLGVHSQNYQPIQNARTAELADMVLGSEGAKYETAGSIQGGKKIWFLANLPHFITIGPPKADDRVKLYVLFLNGHDGTVAWSAVPTPIRVVCKNTLAAATGMDMNARGLDRQRHAKEGVYIRHTGDQEVKIEEVRRVLGLVAKAFEETGLVYQALSLAQVNSLAVQRYLQAVFPLALPSRTPTTDQVEMAREKQAEIHQAIIRCFEGGRGSDLASARGTAWGLYNGVTEYVDHVYPVRKDGTISQTRLAASAFGVYADVKRRALVEALALTS